jgi:1,4-dihydroxy-2-naphthoate octaprenyltransferase
LNKWLIGARFKTLPAAISPVLIGTSYAQDINWINAALALVVALFLQIAVNYANDYSDGIKGTDSNRVGPTRLVASGLASARAVKNASYFCFLIAAIAGSILSLSISKWLFVIGALSILAAWGYTGGRKPYGYLGFGEVSVFVFFGLIATIGSYYIQSKEINWQIFLLSIPVGCLSCAVLVINNLRDLSNDELVGKRTLAVLLGDKKTRNFYTVLLVVSQLISVLAAVVNIRMLFTLICIPVMINAIKKVSLGAKGIELIPILGRTARLQLLLAVITAAALFNWNGIK